MNSPILDLHVPTRREIIEKAYPVNDLALKLQEHAQDMARQRNVTVAATCLRRARALEPDNPVLMALLSGILYDECSYDEAEMLARQSIAIEPNYSPAHGNLAAVLGSKGKYEEAHLHFEEAIKLDPEFPDLKFNYGMSLLDAGKWSQAWPYYEQRIIKPGNEAFYPKLPFPTWKGENLSGKTLHIQGEQGVGDRILFSRYISWIRKEFPEAKLNVQLSAKDLPNIDNLMWAFRGMVNFIPNGVVFPPADYGIFLMSLPGLHGTTPDNVPHDPNILHNYIKPLKHQVALPIRDNSKKILKIGVAWSGQRGMHRSAERNIPFEYILSLAELPNVAVFSVQFDNNDMMNYGAGQIICDLTHQISPFGFVGTAMCMQHFDLVITCCTSVAHLAGSVGVPTWVALCANPYWVWLREREDSVWYKNVRLFRQKHMVGWEEPMSLIKSELEAYANSKEQREAA